MRYFSKVCLAFIFFININRHIFFLKNTHSRFEMTSIFFFNRKFVVVLMYRSQRLSNHVEELVPCLLSTHQDLAFSFRVSSKYSIYKNLQLLGERQSPNVLRFLEAINGYFS